MKTNMIKLCKIKDLGVGDYFLRGRWLYKMSNKRNNALYARRCEILAFNRVKVMDNRKVDKDSEVTLVSLPDTCQVL